MPISLKKGQKVSLKKEAPNLDKLIIGLGWDTNKFDNGSQFDLDATAFLLNQEGKCTDENGIIFYNNKIHPSGCIKHNGDNRTGEGDGDDESIEVTLSKVPDSINKIDFTVTIDQAEQRKQNFGMIQNAYIQIRNPESNDVLIRYDLTEDFSLETAIVVASLYKNNGEWKFSAVGSGFNGGLAALCDNYGIETDEGDNNSSQQTNVEAQSWLN